MIKKIISRKNWKESRWLKHDWASSCHRLNKVEQAYYLQENALSVKWWTVLSETYPVKIHELTLLVCDEPSPVPEDTLLFSPPKPENKKA